MKLSSYFQDFLGEIRLTDSQVADCKTGHETLRSRLQTDETLGPVVVSSFLQGSYRRGTAIQPWNGTRADVDVVVVTKLSRNDYPEPTRAFELFLPFVKKYYLGKYRLQGRSIGIGLSYVDLDLVITASPSEEEMGILKSESVVSDEDLVVASDWLLSKSWVSSEKRTMMEQKAYPKEPEWKLSPLYIPNREAKRWQRTHPLAQMQWTRDKNRRCNGHYVNVVKALKWWRLENPNMPEHPKGYPFEHLIGGCCPDGIESVAEGVLTTLETILTNYGSLGKNGQKPCLSDHGVQEHDVFARVTTDEFAAFCRQAELASAIAKRAFSSTNPQDSASQWRELFGDKFPEAPTVDEDNTQSKSGYTNRSELTQIGGGRFA